MLNRLSGFRVYLFILFVFVLLIITGCNRRAVPVKPSMSFSKSLPVSFPVCSQVPVPCGFRLNTQQKMQAVYHWGLLAGDVADLVKKKIETSDNDKESPIYVVPSGLTPFEKAFHKLLITRLVEGGLVVSNSSKDNIHLSFEIQLINHSKRIVRVKAGSYKSLAPGFFVKRDIPLFESGKKNAFAEHSVRAAEVNTEAGRYTVELPGNELLVTSSLMHGNKYIMRDSPVYYIDDPEWSHYVQVSKFQDSISVVQYKIVGE